MHGARETHRRHRERHRKRTGTTHPEARTRASPLPSRSECAPTAAGLDELAHDGLAVAAARGGEAAHLLRVKAHIVSAADKVSEEQIVAW